MRVYDASPEGLGGGGGHYSPPGVPVCRPCPQGWRGSGQVLQASQGKVGLEGEDCARVSGKEGSQLGPVRVSLSTLLSQVGTVIVSDLRHRVDTELAQGTFKLDRVRVHLPKEEGALGVEGWVLGERQRDRHPVLPAGCHQGDRAATELQS